MPHSLYLGSGFVQHRMRDFDVASGTLHEARASNTKYAITLYRPTISAINSCMKYSIAEMCISLFIITLFINSAILIVAASELSTNAANADLPGKHLVSPLPFSKNPERTGNNSTQASTASSYPPSAKPPARSSPSRCYSPASPLG